MESVPRDPKPSQRGEPSLDRRRGFLTVRNGLNIILACIATVALCLSRNEKYFPLIWLGMFEALAGAGAALASGSTAAIVNIALSTTAAVALGFEAFILLVGASISAAFGGRSEAADTQSLIGCALVFVAVASIASSEMAIWRTAQFSRGRWTGRTPGSDMGLGSASRTIFIAAAALTVIAVFAWSRCAVYTLGSPILFDSIPLTIGAFIAGLALAGFYYGRRQNSASTALPSF